MGLLSRLAEKLGTKTAAPPVNVRSTGFSAADYSRVTSSLVGETRHINDIIRWQGPTLLARARQMARNNPYAAKFLKMVEVNVCGPNPFNLQGQIKSVKTGKPDSGANELIENAWYRWGRPANCDRYGKSSLKDIYRLLARTLAQDGEILIRHHEGRNAGQFGYQVQLIDIDRLDWDRTEQLPGGGAIYCGIELDADGRVLAYHISKKRPADWQLNFRSRDSERIPASQITHEFIQWLPEQVRGVPWMTTAMLNLHQLGAFEEAAVIAARVGAAKMGFFEKNDPAAEYTGEKDSSGAKITDAEPGTFEELPAGLTFKEWNPNYPDAQVGPFIQACLRGVCAGLNVSHPILGQDFSAVNFSSLRGATLEERDNWMMIQDWFVEHICMPIYERWLQNAVLSGALSLNGPLDKYYSVYFQPRRWSWVDPLKDIEAATTAIQWGLKSRTMVANESGLDISDIFDQIAAETKLAEDKNVSITPESPTQGGTTDGTAPDQTGQ
jgi:lambda family phage portal protein